MSTSCSSNIEDRIESEKKSKTTSECRTVKIEKKKVGLEGDSKVTRGKLSYLPE